jgi:hypothetical protein
MIEGFVWVDYIVFQWKVQINSATEGRWEVLNLQEAHSLTSITENKGAL